MDIKVERIEIENFSILFSNETRVSVYLSDGTKVTAENRPSLYDKLFSITGDLTLLDQAWSMLKEEEKRMLNKALR